MAALREETVIDRVEILDSGWVQVRENTKVTKTKDDGTEEVLAEKYRRYVLGADAPEVDALITNAKNRAATKRISDKVKET